MKSETESLILIIRRANKLLNQPRPLPEPKAFNLK
jgi:hypothetical protein